MNEPNRILSEVIPAILFFIVLSGCAGDGPRIYEHSLGYKPLQAKCELVTGKDKYHRDCVIRTPTRCDIWYAIADREAFGHGKKHCFNTIPPYK